MLEAFGVTDTGQVRTSNQDTYRIVQELGLYLLADGMGGARGGATASKIAADTVVSSIHEAGNRDAAALLTAVEDANHAVLSEALRNPQLEGMGTTLVAAIETKANDIAIASVGDSRAYLLRGGSLRPVTVDQSWVQEVGRPMGLDDASLLKHPMRHALTMAVGVGDSVRILYYAVQLGPADILLLSSDGLHGVVPESTIEQILAGVGSLEEKCRLLVDAAHAAGSPDNVTAVLIQS